VSRVSGSHAAAMAIGDLCRRSPSMRSPSCLTAYRSAGGSPAARRVTCSSAPPPVTTKTSMLPYCALTSSPCRPTWTAGTCASPTTVASPVGHPGGCSPPPRARDLGSTEPSLVTAVGVPSGRRRRPVGVSAQPGGAAAPDRWVDGRRRVCRTSAQRSCCSSRAAGGVRRSVRLVAPSARKLAARPRERAAGRGVRHPALGMTSACDQQGSVPAPQPWSRSRSRR
jgi:hypothetical protein